jgi:hypothetical protein
VFNLPVVHPGTDLETGFVHAGHTGMINHYGLGDDFDAFVLIPFRSGPPYRPGHHRLPGFCGRPWPYRPGVRPVRPGIPGAPGRPVQGPHSCRRPPRQAPEHLCSWAGCYQAAPGPGHTGNRHANQVPGLGRSHFRIVHMDPGILVADIGHLHQVLVDSGFTKGILKRFSWVLGEHPPTTIRFRVFLLWPFL